mgnify:CR=1 FL=1
MPEPFVVEPLPDAAAFLAAAGEARNVLVALVAQARGA